jgi:hypothetical protein
MSTIKVGVRELREGIFGLYGNLRVRLSSPAAEKPWEHMFLLSA